MEQGTNKQKQDLLYKCYIYIHICIYELLQLHNNERNLAKQKFASSQYWAVMGELAIINTSTYWPLVCPEEATLTYWKPFRIFYPNNSFKYC